jgi:hypothetical protein
MARSLRVNVGCGTVATDAHAARQAPPTTYFSYISITPATEPYDIRNPRLVRHGAMCNAVRLKKPPMLGSPQRLLCIIRALMRNPYAARCCGKRHTRHIDRFSRHAIAPHEALSNLALCFWRSIMRSNFICVGGGRAWVAGLEVVPETT